MSLDADHVRQLIGRLRGLIEQTGQAAEVERVHHLRTHTRRLEALLQAPPATSFKGKRKLLKRLKRLRRRAGKVRDLDVQMEALASLSRGATAPNLLAAPDGRCDRASLAGKGSTLYSARLRVAASRSAASACQDLQRLLQQDRERQAGKLRRRLRGAKSGKLQKGLQAAEKHLCAAGSHRNQSTSRQAVVTVHRRFTRMKPPAATVPDAQLHAWRIQCKHLRYRLEALGDDAGTRRMIAELKRIQDAVGTWHDWLTLTQSAETLLPAKPNGALLPALQRATARRRLQALRVIASVRRQWGSLR